jgi:nucleoside-diphosphate-sugar epimerase
MNQTHETHVVFGATGALGQALTLRLIAEGMPVRAVARNTERANELLPETVEIVAGEATDVASVQAACHDAAVIYNCVYVVSRDWRTVTENFTAAARDNGARLVFPTNIHPYGPLQQVPATEEHPLTAVSQRGKLRIEMEQQLLDAQQAGDLQVVLPRMAALYGPTIRDGFLAMIFESALHKQKAWWYGSLDMPYDLLCTDDAAMACLLLGTSEGTSGQVWHVPGAGPLTGREFITQVYVAAGVPPDMGTRGRGTFKALGLISPPARAMLEVLYEFEQPLVMDGSKFANTFPDFAYTAHEEAIRETLSFFKERGA